VRAARKGVAATRNLVVRIATTTVVTTMKGTKHKSFLLLLF
jgi:hypothetical protein